MKLNHTGHEVYKCARVAGHTNKFVFQWFNSYYRLFLLHLCIILYNVLVCILYTFEFVSYIHVLCCTCKMYLLAMFCFNVRLVNAQFLLSFLVCLHGQFSVTISLQKAVIIKQKYLLGQLLVFLQPLCWVFKGSEIFFFTY